MPEEKTQPRRRLLGPKADWLPLARAAFRFGVVENEGAKADSEDSLSEALKTSAVDTPAALSLSQLAEILKERSGAIDTNIDPEQCTFTFQFYERRASAWGGPPWAILAEGSKTGTTSDPRSDAEALFNKEGFVIVSDEEAAKGAQEWDAVRKSTGLVWRQFMVREFDRGIAAKKIILWARIGSVLAPFEALLPDVWRVLTILDWQDGIARDPEGVLYYSIHAHRADAAVSIIADESAAVKALAEELRQNPNLRRAVAAGWCAKAGFKISKRGFQDRVWPRARTRAGLPELGLPGRKAKSSR
jgi:hypothetical protein